MTKYQALSSDTISDPAGTLYVETGAQGQWNHNHVIPVADSTSWKIETIRRIAQVLSLPENWDSYGSPPPNKMAGDAAIELLKKMDLDDFLEPHVAPISGGGVQLEWTFENRGLELEITEDGSMDYLKTDHRDPIEEGHILRGDFRRVVSLCSWLISNQQRG